MSSALLVALLTVAAPTPVPADANRIVVASKAFTESRVLAEMMAQLIEVRLGVEVERRHGLGGTLICFEALRNGEIDIYPEYTGTAWAAILKEKKKAPRTLQTLLTVERRLRTEFGVRQLAPFGFSNSYALVMRKDRADALKLRKVSDLAGKGAQLKGGFSMEFLERSDGLRALSEYYGFELNEARGMEHGLAYAALEQGELDLIDAYTTDGKLRRFPVVILEDDRAFFPPYDAAPVVRPSVLQAHPRLEGVLAELAFRIDATTMQQLNHAVEADGKSFAEAAKSFLIREKLLEGTVSTEARTKRDDVGFFAFMASRIPETLTLVGQHLYLTAVSVLLAALLAVPLGIAITRRDRLRKISLGFAGVVQTIPSLALLAFMIPIPGFGISINSAIAALFIYALLPILRNTYTGIIEIDPKLIEAARGIGLSDGQILRHVQLPLAARMIMAGIRTSTIISVGVATLAAFISAGGLGEPIITGLQLNDANLILSGAVPAALLALLVDFLLGRLEQFVTPKGLLL